MDNVGDWLYIVFLIIAAVSGLFSSKDKKKKSRPDISGQAYRRKRLLGDIGGYAKGNAKT